MADEELRLEEPVAGALKEVRYPGFDADIVSMGLVTEARLEGAKAVVRLRPVAAPAQVRQELEDAIGGAVGRLARVEELELEMPEPPQAAEPKEQQGPRAIAGVSAVVPVASGKGGVGKSTVAVNLAVGLQQQGFKVGILDLDLYGPSVPMMLGVSDAQPAGGEDGKLEPVAAHGLKIMSIGFMVPAEKALIWRGPLIMKAVRQLLHDTNWAPLDVLVLDLPPGTGDVQISMTQEVPVTGAVVVTTPQDVALVDAVKGVDLFRHTNAPVLGIVENMSYFQCPDCGSRHEIFGHGSVEPLCAKLGVAYLGELPLDPAVRQGSDQGRPAAQGDSAPGRAYRELAGAVAGRLREMGALEEA
jgi:ATP-binding protein involved in chromosome partitioning